MRENWFPLILLGLYDLLVAESRIEEAKKVIDYFKLLSNNSDNHSFYIDNAYVTNNTVIVLFRCDGDSRDYNILEILKYYNISGYRIEEVKSQI